MSERKRRSTAEKRSRRRKIKIALYCSMVCALIAAIYAGGCAYFATHFFPKTTINGRDCGMRTTNVAYDDISNQMEEEYKITLKSEEGDIEISAKDVGLAYDKEEELDTILEQQDASLWFLHLSDSRSLSAMELSVDEAALTKTVEELPCMNPSDPRASENATITYNKKTKTYEIVEGAHGNLIEETQFTDAIKSAILDEEETFDMSEGDYYKPAEYNETSKEVIDAQAAANKYLAATVEYKSGDKKLKVDEEQISTFVKISDDYKVTLDEDAIEKYVKKTVSKKFTSKKVTKVNSPLSGTMYWSDDKSHKAVNVEKETKKLIKNLKAGKAVKREPKYIKNYHYSSKSDYIGDGENYVDINLSKQKVCVVKNGKKKVESNCVSGNTSAGRGSPVGIWKIAWKTTNYHMVKYNVWVNYWMPYDTSVGIGLHDATWRSSFGGNIYSYDGSHGCINLPLSKAKEIYYTVEAGMPVIVHY